MEIKWRTPIISGGYHNHEAEASCLHCSFRNTVLLKEFFCLHLNIKKGDSLSYACVIVNHQEILIKFIWKFLNSWYFVVKNINEINYFKIQIYKHKDKQLYFLNIWVALLTQMKQVQMPFLWKISLAWIIAFFSGKKPVWE